MKETILISGMHCVSCSLNIEKALKSVNGVTDANVNYAAGKAFVEFDPSLVTLNLLEKTITDTGYEIIKVPVQKNEASHPLTGQLELEDYELKAREKDVRMLKLKFWVSLIFGLPLMCIDGAPYRHAYTASLIISRSPSVHSCHAHPYRGFSILRPRHNRAL